MKQYKYDGPVMRFDDCIQHRWTATTIAATEAKARSNLTDIKRKTALRQTAKLHCPVS